MTRLLHVTTTDISLELSSDRSCEHFATPATRSTPPSAPGPFVARLTADGIAHHPLRRATRAFALGHDAAAPAELYRLFRRLRPDIVHTHNPKPGVYGRMGARAPGYRWRSTPARLLRPAGRPGPPAAGRSTPWSVACSDVELVQNPEDLETLARLRVPRAKLCLLGNGVDLDRFHPQPAEVRKAVRAELGMGDDQVVVGAVGRLVWEKGYAELFAAAGRLLARRHNLAVVVAGPFDADKGDPLRAADVSAAETSGVRFLGHRDDPERLYAAFDIYVLASHREGFPRSAMEAAASGLPIIATDIRGCREVVDQERTGLLVPARDAAALEAAIDRLADDAAARRRLGGRQRPKARDEFDQRRVITRTLEA